MRIPKLKTITGLKFWSEKLKKFYLILMHGFRCTLSSDKLLGRIQRQAYWRLYNTLHVYKALLEFDGWVIDTQAHRARGRCIDSF